MSSVSDLSGLQKLVHDVEQLQKDHESFIRDFFLEMALRALERTIDRTPVGVYNSEVSFTTADGEEVSFAANEGKHGGNLRKNWQLSRVFSDGGNFKILIFNPVYYAEYVEKGHRIVNRHGEQIGWAEGYFMATISIEEIQKQIPLRYERAWRDFCSVHLRGG